MTSRAVSSDEAVSSNEAVLDDVRVTALQDLEESKLSGLVQLINDVYDIAEEGMWKQKGFRTCQAEVESLIRSSKLLLATIGDEIVGCVKLDIVDGGTTGEFGMLVVDPRYRSRGIGKALVQAAEDWAKKQSFENMQLELLTPKTWKHPSKEFAKGWYTRMGYVPQRTAPFGDGFPEISKHLATECEFTIWLKSLN